MTSPETLECRIYVAEDAMYRRSDELSRQLHEVESMLKSLTRLVHRELCESGRTPLEAKTRLIVQAIEDFQVGVDLDQIRAGLERITSLKGLIDGYERQIESSDGEIPSSLDRMPIETLAAAGW